MTLLLKLLRKPRFYRYLISVTIVVWLVIYSYWTLLVLLFLVLFQVLKYGFASLDFPLDIDNRFIEEPIYYPVRSDALFSCNLVYDEKGAVFNDYKGIIGRNYNPAYVAWHGISNLQKWLETKDDKYYGVFKDQVSWLKENYKDGAERGYVWTYEFDWQEGLKGRFKAPWISAMAQGLCISLLVRASTVLNDAECLQIAAQAVKVFELNVEAGGVRHIEDGHALYEEYPAYPLAHVLDGSLFALVGLYDLWRATSNESNKKIFFEGVRGVEYKLAFWNYRNKWSWYGSHGYLCPPLYNKLNAVLLKALYHITCIESFSEMSGKWGPEFKPLRDRFEINIVRVLTLYFLIFKQFCRNFGVV